MNTKHKAFAKHHAVDYNSLPFSGEREDCTDYSHKKKWGALGKAFLRELANDCGVITICPSHNWSGDINRGQVDCFLTNSDRTKFVYVSINDSEMIPTIMYRTAKHEKDYSGGSNHFSHVDNIDHMVEFIEDYLN